MKYVPRGWNTVREYESSDIADNEEDDKNIRQAESRALISIKEKTKVRHPAYTTPTPRTETVPNPAYGTIDTLLSNRRRTT